MVRGDKFSAQKKSLPEKSDTLYRSDNKQQQSKECQQGVSNFQSVPEYNPVLGSFLGSALALVIAAVGVSYATIAILNRRYFRGISVGLLAILIASSAILGLLIGLDPYSLLMRL